MNKTKVKALEKYVRWVADEMELRDWTLVINIGDPGRSNAPNRVEHEWGAVAATVNNRKIVELTFPEHFHKLPDDEVRQTVVHELVHCHFAGMWSMLRQDTLHLMTTKAYWIWIAGVERWMEYGVDAVADAIAPRMPLIEWDHV